MRTLRVFIVHAPISSVAKEIQVIKGQHEAPSSSLSEAQPRTFRGVGRDYRVLDALGNSLVDID